MQLQDETWNIWMLGFAAPDIGGLTVTPVGDKCLLDMPYQQNYLLISIYEFENPCDLFPWILRKGAVVTNICVDE